MKPYKTSEWNGIQLQTFLDWKNERYYKKYRNSYFESR